MTAHMVRLKLKSLDKDIRESGVADPTIPEPGFTPVLRTLRVGWKPSVLEDLRLVRVLEEITDKLDQLCNLEIIEGEAYRLEVLAVADRLNKEDLTDLNFVVAQAIIKLFVDFGVVDAQRKAVVTLQDVVKAVKEAQKGIGAAREDISKAIEFERARDKELSEDIDTLKELLEQQSMIGGLLRPIYIPPAEKTREVTLPNLEGDKLVLPVASFNDTRVRGKLVKRRWEGMQPGEWMPPAKKHTTTVKGGTGEAEDEPLPSPSAYQQEVSKKRASDQVGKSVSSHYQTNVATAVSGRPRRLHHSNNIAPRWTIDEQIVLLHTFDIAGKGPHPKNETDGIVATVRQATGMTRAWNALRLHYYALRRADVTVEKLEKLKEDGHVYMRHGT